MPTSTGAADSPSSSPIRPSSASTQPHRSSPRHLPTGERVQIVLPPATTAGCVAIAIRRPADQVWSIEDLARRGIFRRTRRAGQALDDTEKELLRLLSADDHPAFMRLAVRSRKNILVSGPTGSGKTTWTKALIREIPSSERLVTIEDARSWCSTAIRITCVCFIQKTIKASRVSRRSSCSSPVCA